VGVLLISPPFCLFGENFPFANQARWRVLDERREETLSRLGLYALDDRSQGHLIGKWPM
jgi:hypothetical protein